MTDKFTKVDRGRGGRKRKVVSGKTQAIKKGAKAEGIGRVGSGNVGLGEMIKDITRALKK